LDIQTGRAGDVTAAKRSDFIKACDDYIARVRQYGDARAEQDKALLGWTLDPDRDCREEAEVWREGCTAAAEPPRGRCAQIRRQPR